MTSAAVTALLAGAAMFLVPPAAHAGSIDFLDHHHPGPLEDILHRAHLTAASLDDANPRVIDTELMHARDCRHDLRRGGTCVLRFDDDERIDVEREGARRAGRYRYELIERILDDAFAE